MAPLPPDIRKALALTLHEYELASIERDTADEELAFLDEESRGMSETRGTSEYTAHITNLAACTRRLLALGHADAAVQVAIILGEVLRDDEFDSSRDSDFLERGKREFEAVKKAALRRWGLPEERRKIDDEILELCMQGVALPPGSPRGLATLVYEQDVAPPTGSRRGLAKQAIAEVARIMNERHPGCGVTARKVRRVITGH